MKSKLPSPFKSPAGIPGSDGFENRAGFSLWIVLIVEIGVTTSGVVCAFNEIEKHKKIHEEAIEKATASGHKEAIKQLGEFDETKALHNDTKKIGLIGK